jgi:predicted enzyme related to lactoylglutathione lyase
MIKEIAYTAYPSENVQSTREWYERMLGLTFNGPYAEDGVEKYNEAQIGNGYFSLMTTEWIRRPAGSGIGVFFEVDNIEETSKQLRDKGITVEDIYETPVCKITSFEDPEGNKVSLHEITVPH